MHVKSCIRLAAILLLEGVSFLLKYYLKKYSKVSYVIILGKRYGRIK
jgi:hypothetical protein